MFEEVLDHVEGVFDVGTRLGFAFSRAWVASLSLPSAIALTLLRLAATCQRTPPKRARISSRRSTPW